MIRSAGAILLTAAVSSLTATGAAARILPSSPLDGRWTFTWTPAQVKSNTADASLAGHYLVQFRDGHLIRLLPHPVAPKARFTTRGNVATFVFTVPTVGVVVGRPYEMRWSIYRDRLTWARVPGRAGLGLFSAVPWTRVQ